MAVRKIKNSWWIDFRIDYIRHRKRSPENTKAGAEAYEALLRQKLARGESLEKTAIQQPRTFAQFAEEWFDQYVVVNNKTSEQRNKRHALNASLIPFFGKMPIDTISTQNVEQYKAFVLKKGLGPKTINNQLAILGKCLNTAHEWLDLKGSLPKMKPLKVPAPSTDFLSPEECDLLLSGAEGITSELILTALRTGMRQGEIKGLQWGSIDWQNRTITVRHSLCDSTKELGSTKSNKERHIPMDAGVYTILFNRKKSTGYVFTEESGKPLHAKYMDRRLHALCAQVGLRKIGWHKLRHTFASHLAMRGVPLNAVQALLGHSTIQMTMRYAHLAPSALRTAIDMLNPKMAFRASFGQPAGNQWTETLQRDEKTPVSTT